MRYRIQPALEGDYLSVVNQRLSVLLDKAREARDIIGGERMIDGRLDQPLSLVPTAGAPMQFRNQSWLGFL